MELSKYMNKTVLNWPSSMYMDRISSMWAIESIYNLLNNSLRHSLLHPTFFLHHWGHLSFFFALHDRIKRPTKGNFYAGPLDLLLLSYLCYAFLSTNLVFHNILAYLFTQETKLCKPLIWFMTYWGLRSNENVIFLVFNKALIWLMICH